MPKKIDHNRRIKDLRSGKTAAELATLWKVSANAARKYAKRVGENIELDTRVITSYNKEDFEAFVNSNSKLSYKEIAEKLNLTYDVVYRRVKKLGLQKKVNSHTNEDFIHPREVDFNSSWKNYKALGKKWNVSPKSAWAFCKKMKWI